MNAVPAYFDITPHERGLLARLRFCPAVFLGEPSLRNLRHMANGYQFAMETAGLRQLHNLLPEGLREFTARYLNVTAGSRDCFTMISEREPDDAAALTLFFEILDACLEDRGLMPLEKIHGWEEFRSPWTDQIT